MTEDENKCDMCKGSGGEDMNICTYCNGTGEWNNAAQSYMKNHICQCIHFDRQFCPVCNKKCHHDASGKPKNVIDPGQGGTSVKEKYKHELAGTSSNSGAMIING